MENSAKIPILTVPGTAFNFQKATCPSSLFVQLLEEGTEEVRRGVSFLDVFASALVPSRGCKLLSRLSCSGCPGDDGAWLRTDFRVVELLDYNIKSLEENPQIGDDDDDSDSLAKLEKTSHNAIQSYLRPLLNRRTSKSSSSGFDVDEEEEEDVDDEQPSVRFNDAPLCTSKDSLQLLQPGTIKKMRLTVISSASISDFVLQTTSSNIKKASSSSSFKKTTAKEEPSSVLSPTWKLVKEKVRLVFQAYDIHVKGGTLIDLRSCPLASIGTQGSPSIAFVFVEEASFRQDDGSDVVGRVASKTDICIANMTHISAYEHETKKKKLKVGGRLAGSGIRAAEKLLTSLIEMQKEDDECLDNFQFPHGLLLSGPTGVGKTTVVRATVKRLRANCVLFKSNNSHSNLSSVGESWTQAFAEALQNAQMTTTVLLIPHLDEALLIKQSKLSNPSSKLVNHVCTLFDTIPKDAPLTVVATTDKPFLIPLKLRRFGRFDREIYIGVPSEEDRLEILKSLAEKSSPFSSSFSKLDLASVARRTPGYVGQDLIRVAHLAVLKSHEEGCPDEGVKEAHIKYALSRVLPSVLQGSLGVGLGLGMQTTTSLDHIAGLASVKADLIKAIVWPLKHPHAFRTMGITPPKGILLHSPPGCAKTTLVRAIASEFHTNFLSVSAAELFSSGVGDSEKIVAELFARARMASPCILFIDELEAIVGSRQTSKKRERTTNESILSMLLTEMDGIGSSVPCVVDSTLKDEKEDSSSVFGPLVLVVAATNRLDMIDSALIRPGRFDKLIAVPPLDAEGRAELLGILSRKTPFDDDVDFDQVAQDTEGFTGADVVNLVREAAMLSLSEDMGALKVSRAHVLTARSRLTPSLT